MAQKTLVIFTRYPVEGKTKTRLIPAIGAKKASKIQQLMTENIVTKADQLNSNIKVKIYYAGGNQTLMEQWLGCDRDFTPQSEGDLGQKMYSAIETNVSLTNMPVVIIGIDCQCLTIDILETAFSVLDHHDLVLGPAEDGGYYLIGLNKPIKSLFTNIEWGKNTVYQNTLNIAKKNKLSIFSLPMLNDIDRAEDLVNLPSNIQAILNSETSPS